MNLKKYRGTATELSACYCNEAMQNLALPLACHTVSATLAILSLKDEKKKIEKKFSSRICLICSYHLARSLGGESGHGAIDQGLPILHFWRIYCSSVLLKHRLSQCSTLLLSLI